MRGKNYSGAIGFTILVIVAATVAACGGGGAAGAPSLGGAGGGKIVSVATQRNVAGSALASVGNDVDFDEWGSPGGMSEMALKEAATIEDVHTESETAPTCQNGVEFSQSSTGQGEVTQTIEFFYDPACTEPFKLIVQTISFSNTGGSIQGTEEIWDQTGTVVAYKTFSLGFAISGGRLTSIAMQKSVAPAPSASPFFQVGESCLFGTSNPVDCGAGNVVTISQPTASPSPLNESIGFTGTVTGDFVTPSPSPSPSASPPSWGQPNQLQLQLNGSGYTGAVGALTLSAGTPPAWTIAGGTEVLTLSGTVTLGFGGPRWGGGVMSSIDLDETALGLTVTLSSSNDQLTGNVTNASGQVVATMTLDFSGTGTITYSNGTTAPVVDWIILG
jgi:hypothetical protein